MNLTKQFLSVFTIMIASNAAYADQGAGIARLNCNLNVGDAGNEDIALPFALPDPEGLSEPKVIFTSIEHDIEISYGAGLSSTFSTNQFLPQEEVPVQYVLVNPVGGLSQNGTEAESVYAIDRVIDQFNCKRS